MKQKLLLLGASMLLSTGAFAQLQLPEPTTTPYSEAYITDSGTSSDSVIFYLYNTKAKGFLTYGDPYGTRAHVKKSGLKVFISKFYEEDGTWDGVSYLLNDSLNASGWKYVFLNDSVQVYLDRNAQDDYFWSIEPNSDGTFKLYGSVNNTSYNPSAYPNHYFGLDVTTASNTLVTAELDMSAADAANYYTDWAIVTQEDYATYYAAYQADSAQYEAAQLLKTQLDIATGLGLDVATYNAVYMNAESTVEQYDEARTAVIQVINNYYETSVDPNNPQDVTADYISNYNFNDSFDGWTSTTGAQNNTLATNKVSNTYSENADGSFWENWDPSNFSGKMYTTATVPNGIYNFSVSAFITAASGAYVYINSDSVPTVGDSSEDYPLKRYSVFTVVEDQSIECGIKMPTAAANWMGMDNAQLIYYGNTTEAYAVYQQLMLDAITTDYSNTEIHMTESVRQAWIAAKAALETTASTVEEAKAVISAFKTADAEALASATAYQAYIDYVQSTISELETSGLSGDYIEWVSNYYMEEEPNDDYPNGTYEYILANGQLTTEEITAETAFFKEQFEYAMKNSYVEGSDCTSLIVNNDYDSGNTTGWEGDSYAVGGASTNPCAEAYNKNFNHYQTITGMQKGVYKVQIQAFYRAGWNEASYESYVADPTAESLTEVYVNDFSKPVENLYAEPSTTAWDSSNDYSVTDALTSSSSYGKTVYFANNMTAASYAFTAGHYVQYVYGLVTESGEMTIGIRQEDGSAEGRWSLWDKWQLTYMAQNDEALTELIDMYVTQSESITETYEFISSEAVANLTTAVNAAQEASDGDAKYDALLELVAAIDSAKASGELYLDIDEALSSLIDAVDTYSSTASETVLEEANNLYNTVYAGVDEGSYNTETGNAALTEIKTIVSKLKLPSNVSDATDENPIEVTSVITNPTYADTDVTGWDGTTLSTNSTANNNAEHYNVNYDTYQTIYGLPAGTYKITLDGLYRAGSAVQDDTLTTKNYESRKNAYIYAESSVANYSVAFKNLTEGGSQTALVGSDEVQLTTSGLYAPNTMGSAATYFTAGNYQNELTVQVGEDGVLKIGIKKTTLLSTDWTIISNWQLFYYGADSSLTPDGDAVGIESTESEEAVVSTSYINLGGVEVTPTESGTYIAKQKLASGKTKFVKVHINK